MCRQEGTWEQEQEGQASKHLPLRYVGSRQKHPADAVGERLVVRHAGTYAPWEQEKEGTWEASERRQICLGLALTPVERLQWLEETLEWIHDAHARNGIVS